MKRLGLDRHTRSAHVDSGVFGFSQAAAVGEQREHLPVDAFFTVGKTNKRIKKNL